jgi:hypothetical protein
MPVCLRTVELIYTPYVCRNGAVTIVSRSLHARRFGLITPVGPSDFVFTVVQTGPEFHRLPVHRVWRLLPMGITGVAWVDHPPTAI